MSSAHTPRATPEARPDAGTAALPVSERERAEANAVMSTEGAGHQFEIQLGHLCNNRCVFCSSGQLTQLKLAKPIPLDPIIAAIEDARARGARRVTFLGGEPTLHKGFLAALQRTVELGFEEIVIFTNGVLLPQEGFIDKVVALGRHFEWRISIQGGNEAAHVAVTGRKESFRRILEGLERLQALGQRITANLCVNEKSYRSLPDYPDLVRRYGLQQLHVDIVRPSSAGTRTPEYLREIMPRYTDMAPSFRAMLERFEREAPDFDVNVGNLPFCVLPEWADRIHHGGEQTITTACDEKGLEVGIDKYDWHISMRRHTPRCEPCVFRAQCTGVFGEYLELHGDEEFQPVTLEALEAVDAAQRSFVLLVEPSLAPLLEAAGEGRLPEGFARAEVARDSRARSVEVRCEHAGGGWAALAFRPAGRVAAPGELVVMRTRRYQLSLSVAPELPEEALHALLEWAAERLAAVEVVERLEADAVVGKVFGARLRWRGRARVVELAARVMRRGRFGAWRCGRLRAGQALEASGAAEVAVLEVHGPGGRRIDLAFDVVPRRGRPEVAVEVRLAGGAVADEARPVVEEIRALLRGEPGEGAKSMPGDPVEA